MCVHNKHYTSAVNITQPSSTTGYDAVINLRNIHECYYAKPPLV